MIQSLCDYYRIPETVLGCEVKATSTGPSGFFQFGPEAVCFGPCAAGVAEFPENARFHEATKHVRTDESGIRLPFDADQIIENLRRERYEQSLATAREQVLSRAWALNAYYSIRNFIPAPLRRQMQKAYFSDWKRRTFPAWPVDATVDTLHDQLLLLSMRTSGVHRLPFIWFWPDGASSCVIVTHDVETDEGRDATASLMDLDDAYDFKASFQVIPEERYQVPPEYVQEIRNRGFEFNIHDLNHDGRLYRAKSEFLQRARKINEYVRRYAAQGFRAGSMHRVVDWYDAFEFSYDMSLSTVAHLDPKRGGCCTVFPFFVGHILELPLTTSQDYSLFYILNDYSLDLWKKQMDLVRSRNGLLSFLAHPDYLIPPQNRGVYEALLDYLRRFITEQKAWAALPGEVDRWWRARSRMKLVQNGKEWKIEGEGRERARVAYAVLDGDRLAYEM